MKGNYVTVIELFQGTLENVKLFNKVKLAESYFEEVCRNYARNSKPADLIEEDIKDYLEDGYADFGKCEVIIQWPDVMFKEGTCQLEVQ